MGPFRSAMAMESIMERRGALKKENSRVSHVFHI
jgi:hypothetical protein